MSAIDEAATAKGMLAAPLAVGVDNIGQRQKITFTKYVQVVLPIDGYVFWVRADQVSQSSVFGTTPLNAVPMNNPAVVEQTAATVSILGSLHYATETKQYESEVFDLNHVIFTAEYKIDIFNELNPNEMYLGEFQGIRFTWSTRGSFYKQADLYHYRGEAVYPSLSNMLVENSTQLQGRQIVSNSLPIWLAFNGFVQKPWNAFGNQDLKIYPSYLSETNLAPPYATAHCYDAEVMTSAPILGPSYTHSQLTRERVRFTLYGLSNDQAMNFVDFVNQQSEMEGLFGVSNLPTIHDEKKSQLELTVVGMQKTFELEVTFQQYSARQIAREFIKSVFINYEFN